MPLSLRDRKHWRSRLPPIMLLLALAGCNGEVPADQRIVGGDAERGRRVIAAIECGACHIIPGIRGAHGVVGPPLTEFGRRQLIAGVVPNHPGILMTWVKNAPSIAPNTGMPELPLTDDQARDVAAYLYTLR